MFCLSIPIPYSTPLLYRNRRTEGIELYFASFYSRSDSFSSLVAETQADSVRSQTRKTQTQLAAQKLVTSVAKKRNEGKREVSSEADSSSLPACPSV